LRAFQLASIEVDGLEEYMKFLKKVSRELP